MFCLHQRIHVTFCREQITLESLEQSKRFKALDETTKLIANAIFTKKDVLEVLLQEHREKIKQLQIHSDSLNLKEHERTRLELKQFIVQHGGNAGTEQIEIRPVYESEQGHPWYVTSGYDQRRMRMVRDTLAYQELRARQSEIAEAHTNTFDWIFKGPTDETRPWNSFIDFLHEDGRLYWIHGKPGAGKSTLVKFLKKSPQTEEALIDWAGGKSRLLRCSFFFWNSGLEIQRSEEGFLRSLLWTVLDMCPTLIPFVLKEETTDANIRLIENGTFVWTLESLRRARDRLINQTQYRLFLMIDGLDEFEGDHTTIANWILDATKSPSVKIVVSSRPYNAFRDAFGEVPQLRLQDLTKQDIKTFVESHLMSHAKMKDLIKKDSSRPKKLIADIVDKADGVFLWVRVVVFSFLEGLRNRDRVSELQSRLLALPSDLEDLYEHMLQRTDTFYGGIQSKYILMRLATKQPPPTLVFSLADDDGLEASLDISAVERMPRGEALDRCEEMECRLQASCAGLLEVDYRDRTLLTEAERYKRLDIVDLFETAYGSTIQFIHRTARDYFERPDVWEKLRSTTKSTSFDPNLAMARGWTLALIKLPTGGCGYEVTTMVLYARLLAKKVNKSRLSSDVSRIRNVLDDVERVNDSPNVWTRRKFRLKSTVPPEVVEREADQADDAESLLAERDLLAESDSSAERDSVAQDDIAPSIAADQAPTVAESEESETLEHEKRSRIVQGQTTRSEEKTERQKPRKLWQRLLCCGDSSED